MMRKKSINLSELSVGRKVEPLTRILEENSMIKTASRQPKVLLLNLSVNPTATILQAKCMSLAVLFLNVENGKTELTAVKVTYL